MAYHSFRDEDDNEYGSFEVFHRDGHDPSSPKGWFWWSCFPGCLPDGYEHGPFETEALAIADAKDEN